ncbi:hypothetical protein N7472_000305 [Penicillium cf. griseofulvum]|uniref:Alcohol dehydrogenase-like C-terminal domain-containing protein n=1 Tax=Penicillium cf. griseofulvum TaxID=2972120 RepID=A0A9W9MZ12_9EURO|nr:hypothetical protein N7472_000305 [Penicillium cf. griseofulvum]
MTRTIDVFRGFETGAIQNDQVFRSMSPQDALVEITHSSICGSDKFYLWSPQVLGHESVGIVGIKRGGLGSAAVWDAKALVPIPDKLSSVEAAPLMCSRATAWTVLTKYGINPGHRVGILGIGGLGHMAIKLAAAMGYHVIALSGSGSKREDCMSFGAKELYVASADETRGDYLHRVLEYLLELKTVLYIDMEPLDHLLLCGSVSIDYKFVFSTMATHGTIYPLTVSLAPVPIPMTLMIDNGLRLQGSLVASSHEISEMLQFCAKNDLVSVIERFPLFNEGVQEAIQALNTQSIRYKAVISTQG